MIVQCLPVTINGQALYFILEKPDNLLAWENYYEESPKIAQIILDSKKASEIGGGSRGFSYLQDARNEGKEVYIAYIAKSPVSSDLCDEKVKAFQREWEELNNNLSNKLTRDEYDSKMLRLYKEKGSFIPSMYKHLSGAELKPDFETHYGNIVMSVGVITDSHSISCTHMGIFKNPLIFDDKNYARLSLPLHSFAACWAYENGKRIQANTPIYKMVDILEKGTTHISEEDYENLRKKNAALPGNYTSLNHTNKYPTSVFKLSDITPVFLQLGTDKFSNTNCSAIKYNEHLTQKVDQLLSDLNINIDKEKSGYHYKEAKRVHIELSLIVEQYKNKNISLSVMQKEIKMFINKELPGFEAAPTLFTAIANFLLTFLNLFTPKSNQYQMFRPAAYYKLKNIDEELRNEFSTNL